jgi:hypothetical protein
MNSISFLIETCAILFANFSSPSHSVLKSRYDNIALTHRLIPDALLKIIYFHIVRQLPFI